MSLSNYCNDQIRTLVDNLRNTRSTKLWLEDKDVEDLIEEIRQGSDNAYYTLLTAADESILPLLIESYCAEKNLNMRITLIELIWQQRSSKALEFLADVLQDSESDIWKEALDGIVAIDDPVGIEILEREKMRLLALSLAGKDIQGRTEWVKEALEQLREILQNGRG
jgi:hypothetical protein